MNPKASVTLVSSASAKLRELQATAKNAAELELSALAEAAAHLAAEAAEAADLANIDLYNKARRESLSRIANFLAGEIALLQPVKSAAIVEEKVAA